MMTQKQHEENLMNIAKILKAEIDWREKLVKEYADLQDWNRRCRVQEEINTIMDLWIDAFDLPKTEDEQPDFRAIHSDFWEL